MSGGAEPLELVQRFVNTNDVEGDRERLLSPGALRDWLVDAGLLEPGARLDAGDLAWAIEVRESIRALAEWNNGLREDASGAVAVLNEAARRAALTPELDGVGASTLRPRAAGLDAALGRVVAELHEAAAAGTLARLKACERDTCRWLFFDRSKNRAARWCNPDVCGARERSKRAYRRRRGAGGGGGGAG